MPLTEPLVCEVVMGLGLHSAGAFTGTPGRRNLAKTLEPYVPHYDAILMVESRRGDLRRTTIEHAYIEDGDGGTFSRRLRWCTHLLGRQQPLTGLIDREADAGAYENYFGGR